jgi:phosphoribosylanthranilate isomerase
VTAIKICGLRTPEQALAAVSAGADMIGLVFAASRRRITQGQAEQIVAATRGHVAGNQVRIVGLFVNETPATINKIARHCGLDYIQLSGDETPEYMQSLCRPVIKTIRLNGSTEENAWLMLAPDQHAYDTAHETISKPEQQEPVEGSSSTGQPAKLRFAPCPFIVDAQVPGAYGGTGVLADWDAAAALAQKQRFLLAGGLNPDNVGEAVRRVCPWGVDVSSGVETNGVKDETLIEAFIQAVRSVG